MAPIRQISHRQMELLVEFAERNANAALSRYSRGTSQLSKKAWSDLAKLLNKVEDGIPKTPEKWKRYWHLIKCRTKGKAARIQRTQDSGEGPGKIVPLTDLEERIVNLIARTAEEVTPIRRAVDLQQKVDPDVSAYEVVEDGDVEYEDDEDDDNNDDNDNDGDHLQHWAVAIEERRLASEERLTDAVVTMAKSLQQLVGIMQEFLSKKN